MLQLSLDLYYTEDEIYELSYTKEPKNPKIQVSRGRSNNANSFTDFYFYKRRDIFLFSPWV